MNPQLELQLELEYDNVAFDHVMSNQSLLPFVPPFGGSQRKISIECIKIINDEPNDFLKRASEIAYLVSQVETHYVYPPMPDRRHDWQATFLGYEGGDPIGYGETQIEAIRDLIINRG